MKLSKAVVHYKNEPEGNEQCSKCSMFIKRKAPNAVDGCTLVMGIINPRGWCVEFEWDKKS